MSTARIPRQVIYVNTKKKTVCPCKGHKWYLQHDMWNSVQFRAGQDNHVEIGPVFGPNHAFCHSGQAANRPKAFRNPPISQPETENRKRYE